ncbi:MAG: lipid A biosynthesis protein [Gammaproteobacteria bacterium]|nr:lipid A biosynthesis protein [Gammaproteobacteria bacterium]
MTASGGFLAPHIGHLLPWLYVDSVWWTVFGLLGNGLFSSRFLIQWLQSERKKQLVVPPVFWYLSFYGSLISLIYAFHVDKLPIILGFVFLPFLYARNLKLLRRGGGRAA